MKTRLPSLVVVACCAVASTNNITIHVVNGKNGQPVSNEHLVVFPGETAEDVRQLRKHIDLRTDSKGIAVLPSNVMPWLRVWVDWHRLCQSGSENGIFSLTAIQHSGLVTSNNCGSIAVKVKPCELYIFVLDETLLEKMRQ